MEDEPKVAKSLADVAWFWPIVEDGKLQMRRTPEEFRPGWVRTALLRNPAALDPATLEGYPEGNKN